MATVSTTDKYPTERFPAADEAVKRAHQAYLDHVRPLPPAAADAPKAVPEADGPAAAEGSLQAAQKADALQEAGEDLLRQQQRLIWRSRLILGGFHGAMALVLCIGTGWFFSSLLLSRFRIALPPLLFILVVAAVVSALGWYTARAMQLHHEAGKDPEDIPYLAHLADDCIARYKNDAQPGEDLDALRRQMLVRWNQLRRDGVDPERAERERTLYLAAFCGVLAIVSGISLYQYGVRADEIVGNLFITVLPAAILAFLLMPMSNAALGLPDRSRLRSLDPLAAKAEAERKAAKAKADAKKFADQQHQARMARLKATQDRDFDHQRKQLLFELAQSASRWELERGFTVEEKRFIAHEREHYGNRTLWSTVAAGALALLATYPASITWAMAFGIPFSYPFGIRVTPIAWLAWLVIMLIVEWQLAPNLAELQRLAYAKGVLNSGYKEDQRKFGLTYLILGDDDERSTRKRALGWLTFCTLLLLIEFASNLVYFLTFSESDQHGGIVVAFVPILAFVLLGGLMASFKYRLDWCERAIGRKRKNGADLRTVPARTARDRHRRSASAEAERAYQERGFRDPTGR